MEGGAWWHATGLENRADLRVEGSTPLPSPIASQWSGLRWSEATGAALITDLRWLASDTGRLGIGEPKAL